MGVFGWGNEKRFFKSVAINMPNFVIQPRMTDVRGVARFFSRKLSPILAILLS